MSGRHAGGWRDDPPAHAEAVTARIRSPWWFTAFKLFVVVMLIALVGVPLLRWGYTQYYVSTHCTTVLGTRVCR